MKRIAVTLALLALATTASDADTLLFEDFEDATVTYTTSVPEFTDGGGDFFLRTDGSDIGSYTISGVQGSYYFATMDIDGDGVPVPVTQTFTVSIAGFENLSFSALIGEDDDGTNQDWDEPDYVHIQYQIDGGGYNNLLWFENNGDTFNSAPFVDTNFDGTGDGTELTSTLSNFGAAIAGTGSTLDVQIIYSLDSGDEDIAFDNVIVTGDAVPEPATMGLLGIGGLIALARRRK